MKALQGITLKKGLSAGVMAVFLGAATGCVSTPLILDDAIYYPKNGDYKKHDDYKKDKKYDKNYKKANHASVERLATRKLNAMGYRVEKADYKEKQGIIKTKAYRCGNKYKIDLSYPGMNVVKLKKD